MGGQEEIKLVYIYYVAHQSKYMKAEEKKRNSTFWDWERNHGGRQTRDLLHKWSCDLFT